jgi:hypothetical protein
MFQDFIGKFMQVNIDDIVVKSSIEKDHLDHLQQSFERMRKYRLKMNPLKCAFVVRAGRVVKTGYLARDGLAHDGLGLLRAGPKRPGR